MSKRLRMVKQQLETVSHLDAVMTAMRGIAAAHLSEARIQLDGIREYTDTIEIAIGEVLAFLPANSAPDAVAAHGGELVIVLSAEQGFVGAFNEWIFDAVSGYIANPSAHALIVVGSRGRMAARSRGMSKFQGFAMATRVQAIPALAIKLADNLYERMSSVGYRRVSIIYPYFSDSGEIDIITRSLIPFDYSRFDQPVRQVPPLLTIDPGTLIDHLAREYIFAELCDALVRSYVAENEARVRSMVRAKTNVVTIQESLRLTYQQLRQDQITAEISELATGRIVSSRS